MLLAVAGLNEKAIAKRTEQLARGDWAEFPPAERVAFKYAYKMSREPASVSNQDVEELIKYFGPERALDVIWWTCRCHYMTRVADAFQLPLERENVFVGLAAPKEKK
jgi:hypothetical protein